MPDYRREVWNAFSSPAITSRGFLISVQFKVAHIGTICGDVRYVWQTLVGEIYKILVVGDFEI
jgi:hypothetical protein